MYVLRSILKIYATTSIVILGCINLIYSFPRPGVLNRSARMCYNFLIGIPQVCIGIYITSSIDMFNDTKKPVHTKLNHHSLYRYTIISEFEKIMHESNLKVVFVLDLLYFQYVNNKHA